MPPSRTNSTLFVAMSVLFGALPAFVSCGNGSASDGSGAGGAPSGAGGSNVGVGGTENAGVGGTPFMSLGGAPTEGGTCKKTGEPCTLTGDCCGGNLCNRYGPAPEWIGCQVACSDNSQCPSGCCLEFQGNNGGFCTDAKWCACGTTGSACSSTLPPCCDTHVCLGDAQGGTYSCQQKCTQNSDCPTSCCVLIKELSTSACLDKMYCP